MKKQETEGAVSRPPRVRDARGRFVREHDRLPPGLSRYAAEAPMRLRAIADDPDTQAKLKVDIERFFFEAVYGKNPGLAEKEERAAAGPVQVIQFEGVLEEWSK